MLQLLESNYDTIDAVRPIKISAISRIYFYELGFTVVWWDILLMALSFLRWKIYGNVGTSFWLVINMGIRLPSVISNVKQILKLQSVHIRSQSDVPKGHFAVYVGDIQKKRFVVPISYLNHPSFQDLLQQAEEEFGFNHPMGGLTIPCKEETFIDLASRLSAS
ncbi:hypothetical protein PVL29_004896 [Vitis rotundifolia]|uniref:Small auxin up regulated protein n=1 Tax=Vitis rotundifolia TaxID=103349 RepID=A0AA39E071_VITRO|nr:hypothetical protein PVL29_004896 [Vitis rotundifolia]